ncbi:MAG: DUF5677 domain-containing protein, partial [Planctomycetota bacterium]
MTDKTNLEQLHDEVGQLLKRCLDEIQHHPTRESSQFVKRFQVAQYLLLEAQEYVDATFDLLEAGKSRASLTVCRWVLEAALELLWATAEPKEVDHRLNFCVSEAIRKEANLFKGLAELFPDRSVEFRAKEQDARQQSKRVRGQSEYHRSLDQRLTSLKARFEAKGIGNPYGFYRVCCEAAHPGFAIWRRFGVGPKGEPVSSLPPDLTRETKEMAVRS